MIATISIFESYGCLTAEKCRVYTYGGPEATAKAWDRLTVEIPEGWDLLVNDFDGRELVRAPWGWTYEINEVLDGDDDFPFFVAVDADGNTQRTMLKITHLGA